MKSRSLHDPHHRNSQEVGATCAHGACVNDDYESFFTPDDNIKHHPLPLLAFPPSQNLNTTPSEYVATYVSLLKKLSRRKAIREGRYVHAKVKGSVQESTPYVGNILIQMYGNCGSVKEAQAAFDKISQPDLYSWTALIKAYGFNGNLQDARAVLERMPHRDVVAWTAVMTSYTQHKQGKQALSLFHQMVVDEGIMPDTFAFVCALDACSMTSALECGKSIHASMVGSGSSLHMVVETALITFYGNCGSMFDARNVFDNLPCRDVVCWNVMISACVRNEEDIEALMLFNQMLLEGNKANNITYVCVLNVCANLAAFNKGQVIHLAILDSGLEQQTVVSTALINMYGKCKSVCCATKVFALLSHHDVVSWTSMIAAFSYNSMFQEALKYFNQMYLKDIKPDRVTYVCAIDASAELAATAIGLELHAAIMFTEHAEDTQLGNALFYMYIKCRCVCDARKVFDMLPLCNSAAWNALIEALTDHGHHREVLHLFSQVRYKDLKPNDTTYTCVVNACTKICAIEEGNIVHAAIVESSNKHQLVNGTALVNMYGKSGRIWDAKAVFNNISDQDIVAWNAMITSLIQTGNFQEALDLFHRVVLLNVEPSDVSFVCAIEACSGLLSLKDGHEIHAAIVHTCYSLDMIVGTALVNMYGKFGCLSDARRVLQCSPRDVVTFTTLIAAFVQNGFCKEALDLFADMLCDAVKPDSITILCALEACAILTAAGFGLTVHMIAVESGYEQELVVGTSLINMYGNCGSVQDANKLFDILSHRDIGTWNAMLGVLSHNGNGEEAKVLFLQLQRVKVMPDYTTFICILAAFSHAGMIDDGWHLFDIMSREYCLVPVVDHFICMVDLLGRAGHLDMGELLINVIPVQRASFAWRCLLGACKIHGNMEKGENVATFCFEQDGSIDAPYVMLSNLYAAVGKEDAPASAGGTEDEWHEIGNLAYGHG